MLFIERSNQTEQLLAGLAKRLTAPGRDPLATSTIVVQGPGMERWLAQSVAREFGICANVEFLFPREFIERIFEAAPAESEEWGAERRNRRWEPGSLLWAVARRLVDAEGDPDFAPLQRYLEAPDGDWRRVQLASQLGLLFDQYITFRPDWIREWQAEARLPEDSAGKWQARLLRELEMDLGPGHLVDRADAFSRYAKEDPAHLEDSLGVLFPDRIEVFAISTLPPLFLSAIHSLSQHRDVSLSVLCPSRSYWADLWREVKEADLSAAVPTTPEEGRPGLFDLQPASPTERFLAGLGQLGGDFQKTLEEQTSGVADETDRFVSPVEGVPSPSLLLRLQADLLDLGLEAEAGDRVVEAGDDSIQVHWCHGPRRELEVVEATLRGALERDPTLTPEDVIVMAPQIDEIAPEIEAVFSVSREEGRGIPHRIADRGAFRRSPVAETFRAFLDLLGGRVTRSELFDWLAREPARLRFGLDEEAVERLGDWAEGAGIRFGLDEEHRAELGVAKNRKHTLADGLDRLTLAHAVGPSAHVFAGITASPLDPFSAPDALGALGAVETLLQRARVRIRRPVPVAAWCAWLTDLLAASCGEDDANAHEHASIRRLLQDLSERAVGAAFLDPLPFEAIREQVAAGLSSTPAPQAFLAGGVTFCELVPLRAIPFRVVVILGLRDGAFPRGRPAVGFDLMADTKRAGDRDTRSDDRYLFLEALLSAREQLILTLPGRDLRDGSDLPPSIVVTELLDTLDASFVPAADAGIEGDRPRTVRDQVLVNHPLQPFNARYFESPGDRRLFGRDAEAFAGAMARTGALETGGGEARNFTAGIGSAPAPVLGAEPPHTLSVAEWSQRLLRATRFFVRNHLQLRLPRIEDAVDDLDPIGLGPLDRFVLGDAMLRDLEAGTPTAQSFARLRAHAILPHGEPGEIALRALRAEVVEIDRIARKYRTGERLPDVEQVFDFHVPGLGDCRLTGPITSCWETERVESSFGRLGTHRELGVYLQHIFLCACIDRGLEREPTSYFIARPVSKASAERVAAFSAPEDIESVLPALFEWAWRADASPLPFFPKSSRVFAEKLAAGEGQTEAAWQQAFQSYFGGDSSQGNPEFEEELEHARLWEGRSPLETSETDPLSYSFDQVATAFFEPFSKIRSGRSR